MRLGTRTWQRVGHAGGLAMCAALIVAVAGSPEGFSQSPGAVQIRVLSSRPDLVSGGDALVEVTAASDTPAGV